jgi:NAD-specific glutamate dehydrogenase
VHAELTREVLGDAPEGQDGLEAWWAGKDAAIERCLATLADIRASRSYDTTTLPVALREVRALTVS